MWHLLITFLTSWNHICFFPFIRKLTFSTEALNIFSKGLGMDAPQILSIRILIIWWPWASLGLRSQIILVISLLLNNIDEITFSVLFKNVDGNLLELFLKEHSPAKEELNISAFALKSVAYLFWWLKCVIQWIFFYYSKIYSKLTKGVSHWLLDQPTYLINGSSIFVYYFPFSYWIQLVFEIFNFTKYLRSLFALTYLSFFSRKIHFISFIYFILDTLHFSLELTILYFC